MTIVECRDDWRARWNAYAESCPDASLYHLWDWSAVNREIFGHRTIALAAVEHDRIVGILPIVLLKSWLFGKLACSMPFVNYGGPASDNPAIDAALLAEAARIVEREHLTSLEVRAMRPLGGGYPTLTHKVSMTVDLPPDPDVMWNGFKSAHRQDIRKAAKSGFEVTHGGRELVDPFYRVLSESWRDLGTPFYQKRYFQTLFDRLGDRLWITIITQGGQPAAAQLSGVFRTTAEGMWLGVRNEFRKSYVGYLLYWEILKYASERGQRRYHLGRSTADSGAEAFKRKWNAHAQQLYWHYLLAAGQPVPTLRVDNPKYRLAIDIWRKLPLGVAQALGPRVARSIP